MRCARKFSDTACQIEKEGGISMRDDSKKTTGNMISMEEYLKKRQAIRQREPAQKTKREQEAETVLKLTELLYV